MMTANDEIDLKHFYSVLSQSQSEQTLDFFFSRPVETRKY